MLTNLTLSLDLLLPVITYMLVSSLAILIYPGILSFLR